MLKIECDGCDEELTEPGALMFAPPNEFCMTRKWHLCVKCWLRLMTDFFHTQ